MKTKFACFIFIVSSTFAHQVYSRELTPSRIINSSYKSESLTKGELKIINRNQKKKARMFQKYGTIDGSVGQPIPSYVFLESDNRRKRWIRKQYDTYTDTSQGINFTSTVRGTKLGVNVQGDETQVAKYRAAQELATNDLNRQDEIGDAYNDYRRASLENLASQERSGNTFFEGILDNQLKGYQALIESSINEIEDLESEIKKINTSISELEDDLKKTADQEKKNELDALNQDKEKLLSDRSQQVAALRALYTNETGQSTILPPSNQNSGNVEDSLNLSRTVASLGANGEIILSATGITATKGEDGKSLTTELSSNFPQSSGVGNATSVAGVNTRASTLSNGIDSEVKNNFSDGELGIVNALRGVVTPQSTQVEVVKKQKAFRDYLDNLENKAQYSGLINFGGFTTYKLPKIRTPANIRFRAEVHSSDKAKLVDTVNRNLQDSFRENYDLALTYLTNYSAPTFTDEQKIVASEIVQRGYTRVRNEFGLQNNDSLNNKIEYRKDANEVTSFFTSRGLVMCPDEEGKLPINRNHEKTEKGYPFIKFVESLEVSERYYEVIGFSKMCESLLNTLKEIKGLYVGAESEDEDKLLAVLKRYDSFFSVLQSNITKYEISPINDARDKRYIKKRLSGNIQYLTELVERYNERLTDLAAVVSLYGAISEPLIKSPIVSSVSFDENNNPTIKFKGLEGLVKNELAQSVTILSVDPDETVEEIDDLRQHRKTFDFAADTEALTGNIGISLGLGYLSSKLNASAFKHRVVTMLGRISDEEQEFGWTFLPSPSGGIAGEKETIKTRIEPKTITVSATIKVPAFVTRINLTQDKYWGYERLENPYAGAFKKAVYLEDFWSGEDNVQERFLSVSVSSLNDVFEPIVAGWNTSLPSQPAPTALENCNLIKEMLPNQIVKGIYPFSISVTEKFAKSILWVELGSNKTADLYRPNSQTVVGSIDGVNEEECVATKPCSVRIITNKLICDTKNKVLHAPKITLQDKKEDVAEKKLFEFFPDASSLSPSKDFSFVLDVKEQRLLDEISRFQLVDSNNRELYGVNVDDALISKFLSHVIPKASLVKTKICNIECGLSLRLQMKNAIPITIANMIYKP